MPERGKVRLLDSPSMRADPVVSPGGRVRSDLDERRRAKARALRLRRRLAIGCVVGVVVGAVGAGVGFAGSTDRIADGVTIAGVDVGGMTAEEATRALEQRAAELADDPVEFTAGGETITLRPQRLGIQASWDAAVEQALAESDGFLLFRGFKRLALRFGGTDVAPPLTARPGALDRQIERLTARIDRAPREAAIVLEGLEPVVVPGQTGVALDREAAAAVLVSSLGSFERGGPVPLPTRIAPPDVSPADLRPVAQQVRTILSGPVTLSFRKASVTIGPKKLATFLSLPSEGSTEVAIGGNRASRYFANIAKAFDREPKNARFTLASSGAVKIVPSADGRALDPKATKESLLAAALSPTGREGDLVVATAAPKITTEKAKGMGIVGVVGSYTTTYGGEPNRLHNVEVVSRLIDDHLIAPGEVFSFNTTTGERNADKGFLEAPVIINGELQTGIGGGVCQVSTTVFNAAFEAGLSIEARTNHGLYISHYPTGRDATVNYPDIDLKFKNDTGHWLWLRAFVGPGSLTINLYGTPVDRRVEFETTTPLEATGPIPEKKVGDPSLYAGEEVVEDAGEPPRRAGVRRIVYDAKGNVLYDTTWNSTYQAEPKIVRVGTKPVPEETKPAPEEEAKGDGSAGGTQGGGQTGGQQQNGAQQQEPPAAGSQGGTQAPPATEQPPASGEPPVIGA